MGLEIENPTEAFYQILKSVHQSVTETLQLRVPFSPDTELAGQTKKRYVLRRALIESVAHGSHQFLTEGTLERVQFNANGLLQFAFNDSREFEGWRKVS